MNKMIIIVFSTFALLVGSFFVFRLMMKWDEGMVQPRSEVHAATVDGKIYVAGGIGLFRVLDSCEYYDIEDKKWGRCASLPRPLHHVAMTANDRHVYASGGYVGLPFKQDVEASLFVYDPTSDIWAEIAKLPHPMGQHVMVHRAGRLFLIGGQNGSKDLGTVWTYDIAIEQWVEMASMPTPRHSHAAALTDDKLYVTGGRSAALGSEIDIIEVYDFQKNSWAVLPNMPTGRAGHGAFVREGKLHIFGGESLRKGVLLANHEILDLQTGRWSQGNAMPKPRHGFAIGDDQAGNSVHAIGGGAHPGLRTIYSVTGTVQKISN